jgi:GTP-binding protein
MAESGPVAAFASAHFQVSAQRFEQCPADDGMEVAFAGRSNAGKSSAINTLTRQRALARTSKTPGRTQLLNFFAIGDVAGTAPGGPRRLVDLPGYGYAKVPEPVKHAWEAQIARYLEQRRSLRGLVVVMDCRHPLKPFDRNLMQWCAARGLPVHLLLTKADKLTRSAATATLAAVRREITQSGCSGSAQLFSALKKQGLEELQQVLFDWLELAGT